MSTPRSDLQPMSDQCWQLKAQLVIATQDTSKRPLQTQGPLKPLLRWQFSFCLCPVLSPPPLFQEADPKSIHGHVLCPNLPPDSASWVTQPVAAATKMFTELNQVLCSGLLHKLLNSKDQSLFIRASLQWLESAVPIVSAMVPPKFTYWNSNSGRWWY